MTCSAASLPAIWRECPDIGAQPLGQLPDGDGDVGQLRRWHLGEHRGLDQVAQRRTQIRDRSPTDVAVVRQRLSCRGPPRACEWWGAGGSFLMPASRSNELPMITRCTSLVPS